MNEQDLLFINMVATMSGDFIACEFECQLWNATKLQDLECYK